MKVYVCCDERRRDAVLSQHTIKGVDYNGIDYLEVSDTLTLLVHFIHALKPGVLEKENVRILGGERISDVAVLSAEAINEGEGHQSKLLQVKVNKQGDYSTYTLLLSADSAQLVLDPQLSSIDFTFKLPSDDIDCQTAAVCLPETQPAPEIDYLAKDFTSFRQLMLDRLTMLMPQWKERSAADMGVMLVELLAYVADHLSYQQDVVATESYLSTARRRISVRRHVRLLDYFISEGCNARVWVRIQVNQNLTSDTGNTPVLPQRTKLLTQVSGQNKVVLVPDTPTYYQALSTQPAVFETMAPIRGLFVNHNEMFFYTWGERECCLPKGSTHGTLRGAFPKLEPGDVLVFKELVDPRTGVEEDAEPSHRHAVRLTKVLPGLDPLGTWPDDKSGIKDDPTSLGKVVAEFSIVEEDRLLVEEARMTTSEAGHRVEKLEEHYEEETHTIVHRYLIEKPDKSTVTVEVRMREDEREVRLDLLATGHVLTEEHVPEEYFIEADRDEKSRTRGTTERVLKGDQTRNADQEMEEDLDELMRRPTDKLAKESTRKYKSPGDIADEDTIEYSTDQDTLIEEEKDESETTQEQFAEEEHWEDEDTSREVERKRTRIVHTYRIVREPDYSVDVTEIEWDYEDALPFPLCISATTSYEHGHRYIENVSVALGNIVLADHGLTYLESDDKQKDFALIPNSAPAGTLYWATTTNCQYCQENQSAQPAQIAPHFYPRLRYTPVTFAAPYDEQDSNLSASAVMQFNAHDAVASITLRAFRTSNTGNPSQNNSAKPATNSTNQLPIIWQPRRDLLQSEATDTHFVVEVETDGNAFLRFGDDQHGMRPDPSTKFLAAYRVGNGVSGNIGRDSLYHIVTEDTRIQGAIAAIGNPLPALGGIDPESIEDTRKNAEGAFLQQERGVTPQDYKALAEQDPQVHRANAILRWTGSWYTIFLVVERVGGLAVDDVFKRALRQRIEQFRMAGTELVLVSPIYVPLEITMNVTLKSGSLQNNVKIPFMKVFSNHQWPDGERGIFYPDNYTFGQSIYLNPLLVAASAVPGVDTVAVTRFQRQGIPGMGVENGMLPLDWLELPILENNPYYPERGIFRLNIDAKEAQHV